MTQRSVLTRRAVVLGALTIPGASVAAPLLDMSSGGGLFSKPAANPADANDGLNLFGEPPATQRSPVRKPSEFRAKRALRLALENPNTDETLELVLRANAGLDATQTQQIHKFLRDWRRNEIKPIDGGVLSTLLEICDQFTKDDGPVRVRITSGYRSKATNEQLRRSSRNVARNSLHVQARAIDFSLPDVPVSKLARTARRVCPGGVGRYANFIHIDSGPLRRWSV